MTVLFIGGTGIISSACSPLAVENGIDLYLLNRGESDRPVPGSANVLIANYHDPDSVNAALGSRHFDVVVNWIAFTPDRIEADLELFRGRTDQYVFISSASACSPGRDWCPWLCCGGSAVRSKTIAGRDWSPSC